MTPGYPFDYFSGESTAGTRGAHDWPSLGTLKRSQPTCQIVTTLVIREVSPQFQTTNETDTGLWLLSELSQPGLMTVNC